MPNTSAEEIVIRSAVETDLFQTVPDLALSGYAIVTDDNGSWILTTSASASALAPLFGSAVSSKLACSV